MRGRGKRVAMWAGVMALAILGPATWFSWPQLRFWWLFQPLGPNAQGYSEYRHRKTGIVFVSLPGGKFLMGAQKDDPKAPNYDPDAPATEGPVHEASLSAFLIGKHEVTQAQWNRVMGVNVLPPVSASVPSGVDSGSLPVRWVSWNDCQDFYRKTQLKLPTEAQWEYACRAKSGPFDGPGRLEDMGSIQPNGFGLHDMLGNNLEWCEDVCDWAFYATPGAAGLDPVCTSGIGFRVLRGGESGSHYGGARCALCCTFRGMLPPGTRDDSLGFRAVASPPP